MSKSKNTEGLRYPSIDELLTNIESKYKLAYAAAMRAKIIREKEDVTIDYKCSKPVGVALEEIKAGKVKIDFEK